MASVGPKSSAKERGKERGGKESNDLRHEQSIRGGRVHWGNGES